MTYRPMSVAETIKATLAYYAPETYSRAKAEEVADYLGEFSDRERGYLYKLVLRVPLYKAKDEAWRVPDVSHFAQVEAQARDLARADRMLEAPARPMIEEAPLSPGEIAAGLARFREELVASRVAKAIEKATEAGLDEWRRETLSGIAKKEVDDYADMIESAIGGQ